MSGAAARHNFIVLHCLMMESAVQYVTTTKYTQSTCTECNFCGSKQKNIVKFFTLAKKIETKRKANRDPILSTIQSSKS